MRFQCACGQLLQVYDWHACPFDRVTKFSPAGMLYDVYRWHSASAYPRDRAMAARLALQQAAA